MWANVEAELRLKAYFITASELKSYWAMVNNNKNHKVAGEAGKQTTR